MNASGPTYALKTTWRFLVLIYSWAVLLVIVLATSGSWMPSDEGAAIFLAAGFGGSVILLACFSLAAVGWALWSFRGRTSADRLPAWVGLLVALITLALSIGYLLLLTGIIRR